MYIVGWGNGGKEEDNKITATTAVSSSPVPASQPSVSARPVSSPASQSIVSSRPPVQTPIQTKVNCVLVMLSRLIQQADMLDSECTSNMCTN